MQKEEADDRHRRIKRRLAESSISKIFQKANVFKNLREFWR